MSFLKVGFLWQNNRNSISIIRSWSWRDVMGIREHFKNDEARAFVLNSLRQEMYRALELFHNHVKYTLSMIFSLITAVLLIFKLGTENIEMFSMHTEITQTIAATLLCFVFPLGIISAIIIGRYYKLYVAALVYAAKAHQNSGIENFAWFTDITTYESTQEDKLSEKKLINRRAYTWPHSWSLYALLIVSISTTSLILGISIIFSWF